MPVSVTRLVAVCVVAPVIEPPVMLNVPPLPMVIPLVTLVITASDVMVKPEATLNVIPCTDASEAVPVTVTPFCVIAKVRLVWLYVQPVPPLFSVNTKPIKLISVSVACTQSTDVGTSVLINT